MFKNSKIISLILLCSCTVANNEKIYTDLIPTIRNKGEGSIASIQEKNLFVCNIDEKKGPQSFCDKDGKLFNGTITQNYDDIKIQYIFKNGKPVNEKDFENGKLVSSSNIKMTFPIDLPRIYSTKYYDENGKISSEYKFDNGDLTLNPSGIYHNILSEGPCKTIRSSFFMTGALLSKFNNAKMVFPGGCNIGLRPIDAHIDGLIQLGVDVKFDNQYINFL